VAYDLSSDVFAGITGVAMQIWAGFHKYLQKNTEILKK